MKLGAVLDYDGLWFSPTGIYANAPALRYSRHDSEFPGRWEVAYTGGSEAGLFMDIPHPRVPAVMDDFGNLVRVSR